MPAIDIIEKPFQNWTRTTSEILGTVYIYADYKLPVAALREELTHILDESSLWDGKVNSLQVTNLTDRIMELRALMSAKDASIAWNLRVEVREKLVDFLQQKYPDCLPRTRIELNKKD